MAKIKGFREVLLDVRLTRPRLLATVGLLTLCAALPLAHAQTSDQTTKELQDLPPLPDYPNPITMENQVQYFELWRDDKRPWKGDTSSANFNHRRLIQEFKVNPKLTYDQAVLEDCTKNQIPMAEVFEILASAINQGLLNNQSIYFKGPLSKIKEIHLISTNKKIDTEDFGHQQGYFFSFNKATGVMAVALIKSPGTIGNASLTDGADSPLPRWIIKNVK